MKEEKNPLRFGTTERTHFENSDILFFCPYDDMAFISFLAFFGLYLEDPQNGKSYTVTIVKGKCGKSKS